MTSSQGTDTGPPPASPELMTKAEFCSLYERLRADPPRGQPTGAAR